MKYLERKVDFLANVYSSFFRLICVLDPMLEKYDDLRKYAHNEISSYSRENKMNATNGGDLFERIMSAACGRTSGMECRQTEIGVKKYDTLGTLIEENVQKEDDTYLVATLCKGKSVEFIKKITGANYCCKIDDAIYIVAGNLEKTRSIVKRLNERKLRAGITKYRKDAENLIVLSSKLLASANHAEMCDRPYHVFDRDSFNVHF